MDVEKRQDLPGIPEKGITEDDEAFLMSDFNGAQLAPGKPDLSHRLPNSSQFLKVHSPSNLVELKLSRGIREFHRRLKGVTR